MAPKSPEILAPAGSPEALLAAVAAGADAVYLGGLGFNARRGAKNFDRESLFRSLAWCRAHGVRTHLTFNTLLFDRELPALAEAMATAAAAGADAFILQDLAAVRVAKEVAPQVQRHGSTQMSVHTLEGAVALYEMGFTRVVLARELSREQIRAITEGLRERSIPLETEIFVHGAHCMCVSGQCYMSAFLGGRSGNRGLCAQPCRLPFAHGNMDHALSLKDLSLLPHLEEIAALGVDSLKIEGRMKRPEYVYAAAKAACKAREGSLTQKDMAELAQVFSRSGFTDGFYQNRTDHTMFGIRQQEPQDPKTQAIFQRLRKEFPADFPADFRPDPAKVPVAPDIAPILPAGKKRRDRAMALWARFESLGQLPREAALLKKIILPLDTDWAKLPALGISPEKVLAELPRWSQREPDLLPLMERAAAAGIPGALVQNIAQLSLCRRAGLAPVGGFGLNVANSLAAKEWQALGLTALTASFELNLPKVRELPADQRIGILAYGHLPLMLLRACPARAKGGCRDCRSGKPQQIRDRKGMRFLLRCSGTRQGIAPELLNPLPLCLWDKKKELDCADFLLLHFTFESKKDCAAVLTAYQKPDSAPPLKEGTFTRGLCFKPID